MKKLFIYFLIFLYADIQFCSDPKKDSKKPKESDPKKESKKISPEKSKNSSTTKRTSPIYTSAPAQSSASTSQKDNQEDENEKLSQAIKDNNLEEVKKALAAGADKFSFSDAIETNNPEIVKILINTGKAVIDEYHLFDVALKGNPEILKMVLDAGNFDPNTIGGRMSTTPLMHAIESGNPEAVELLLKRGTNVDSLTPYLPSPFNPDNIGINSLHYVIRSNGNARILKELLKHNANVTIKNSNGQTTLHTAAQKSVPILKILLDHIEQNIPAPDKKNLIEAKDKEQKTALHAAAESGNEHTVKLLLDNGADIDVRDKNGETPLHLAAEKNIFATKALLDAGNPNAGANIHQADNNGNTALHHAAKGGHTDITRLLLDKGFNMNQLNKKGKTALHIAAEKNDITTVKELLDHGADANLKDFLGKTALDYAKKHEHEGLNDIIKKHAEKQALEKEMLQELQHYNVHNNIHE